MTQRKKSDDRRSLRWLIKRARTARCWVLISVGLGFSGGLLLVVQAAFLAQVIQSVYIDQLPRNLLLPLFAGLAAVILLRACLAWAREISGFKAGAKVREAVRLAVMEHIVSLGPAYVERQRTGSLASTILEQIEGLHEFFAYYLPQLALAVMIPLAIAAFVFPLSWAAGGLLIVSAPLIPLFMILVGMGAESISQRNFQAMARLSAHFLDVLQGLSTLKLFGRSRKEADNVDRSAAEYRRQTMQVLRVAFLSSAVLEFFSSMAIALVAVYLGMRYLGYLNFGDYGSPLNLAGGFFILLLAPDFYLPLRELGTHYHARAEAVGAGKEILKILDMPEPAKPEDGVDWPGDIMESIRFEDVQFTYDEDRVPALEKISFVLSAGEHVALVGASGSGKTTVLNLLMGFIAARQGSIRINGMFLERLAAEQWRRQIAWIGQNPILFHGSLRKNILLGNPDADEARLLAAVRSARVTEFSQHLPEGLDTPVGEQGIGLSRGQAQRVALARAFLKDAPLVLLDEPTSGLDSQNERFVLDAMNVLTENRTVLMATHRLESIRRSDRILVMDRGRIIEQGTYRELMAARGKFYRLVRRETDGEVDA